MKRTLPRTLVLLLALCASAASAEPQILLFPGLATPTEVVVMGRVLKEAPSPGSSTLSRNLRRLTASDWEGAPVEVSWRSVTAKTKAGEDGVFSATLTLPKGEAAEPGLDEIHARAPGTAATATIRVIDPAAKYIVISDFDDTIAVSNILDKSKMVKASLLQDATTQPVVSGMAGFYQCLVEDHSPMPGLAVVSGSPHQYATRIARFLSRNGFPFTALYLRDFSLKTLSDYKQPIIRALMQRFSQPFILVGDSGEKDPEIYAQMRQEFPGRVLRVYIHDVGRTEDPGRFRDMVVYKDGRDAAKDAVEQGLVTQECFDRKFGGGAK